MATSEKQKLASKVWQQNHRKQMTLIQNKSRAKNYILKHANAMELRDFEEYIKQRREELRDLGEL